MILNAVERALMNNPARTRLQRSYEARVLHRLGDYVPGEGHAREVGCGKGAGAEVPLGRFGVKRLDAFDLDPRMVALARRRLRARANVWQGDATTIAAAARHL